METNELVTGPIDGQVRVAYKQINCPGDCNYGVPCQICGSNGQYIGIASVVNTTMCGQCAEFGPNGCVTGKLERKYGGYNTPVCDEFKQRVKETKEKCIVCNKNSVWMPTSSGPICQTCALEKYSKNMMKD